MKFRILGGLEAETGSGLVALGGPNEQKALAVLLLNAGRWVPVTSLVDALWEDNPPATAVKQAQNAVGRLRSRLSVTGEADFIVTERGGYRLRIDWDALDAHVFEARVARANTAARAGDLPEAVALLRAALDLWRGGALAGLSGQAVEAAADGSAAIPLSSRSSRSAANRSARTGLGSGQPSSKQWYTLTGLGYIAGRCPAVQSTASAHVERSIVSFSFVAI